MSMRARRRGAGRARGERRALRGQSRPSGQLVERRCGGANHRVRSTSRTRRWHRRPRSRRCAAWCSGGVHVVMTNASECRSDFARLEDCGVSVHLYTGTATAPTPSCSSLTAGRRRSARRTCLRGGCRTTGSSERSLSRSALCDSSWSFQPRGSGRSCAQRLLVARPMKTARRGRQSSDVLALSHDGGVPSRP
jgi:hypothetical protein